MPLRMIGTGGGVSLFNEVRVWRGEARTLGDALEPRNVLPRQARVDE